VKRAKENDSPSPAGKNGHKVRIGKLSEFRPQTANANLHTERGLRMLDDSMSEDGYVAPMTAAADREVIDGSARLERAYDKFNDEAIIVEHDGRRPIIAVRTDIPNAQTVEAQRIAVRANRIAQVDLSWNPEILSELAPEALEGMFSDKELAEILSEIWAEPKDAEPQIDKAEELRQKWDTETGQLWVIGSHRLLVGDSTNKADVAYLCGDNKPLLMVTDPPYGVEYDPHWRDEIVGDFGQRAARGNAATNDDLLDWSKAFELFEGSAAYVWHAGKFAAQVALQLTDCGFEIRNQIVWAKQHFAISRGNYHWQHEPCWYAVKKGRRAEWVGDRTQSTLWEISSLNPAGRQEERYAHGTQKPLECMARPIRNHSGDVYDPFVGSGTTLVAAENLNRKCYAIEISPAYVAVCLERMATTFPHLKIEKVSQAEAVA
jgi:DNA modification methylase